jgi:hypothetical protein
LIIVPINRINVHIVRVRSRADISTQEKPVSKRALRRFKVTRGLFDLTGRVVLATGARHMRERAGVRANMIAPGFIKSGFMEGASREQVEGIVRHFSNVTPLGRVGEISDIEGPAAYLASDASKFHPATFSSSTVAASSERLDPNSQQSKYE